jgi:hypothetical protein
MGSSGILVHQYPVEYVADATGDISGPDRSLVPGNAPAKRLPFENNAPMLLRGILTGHPPLSKRLMARIMLICVWHADGETCAATHRERL